MAIITPELLTDILKGALLSLAGAAGKSVTMIGGEWIKIWQMNNAVIVGEKAVKILKNRGITNKNQLRSITTKFGILYIEGASVEDQPELQKLWAQLLANAVDPNFKEELRSSYITTISDLNTLDAIILEQIHEDNIRKPNKTFFPYTEDMYTNSDFKKNYQAISWESIEISFDNLRRLRLIDNISIELSPKVNGVNGKIATQKVDLSKTGLGGGDFDMTVKTFRSLTQSYVYLTPLGKAFVNSCIL